LRLARLLRLAPLFRVAFTLPGLRYASFLTLLVVLTGAEAFESAKPGKDCFDGVYVTSSGRRRAKVVAMVLMFVGIGYAAVVTGALAERFIQRGGEEQAEALGDVRPDDLAAHVDRLTVTTRALVAEPDALRTTIAGRGPPPSDG
jgi:voltage-gated potassium channel